MNGFARSMPKSALLVAYVGCALGVFVIVAAVGSVATAGEDLVLQKLKMLENYLASPKIEALKSVGSGPRMAQIVEGENQLNAARAALAEGNLDAAAAALDRGLQAVASAVRGAKDARAMDKDAHARYLARRRQVDLYLDAVARSVSVARLDSVSTQIERIRGLLEEAEVLARQARFQEADQTIARAHAQTVKIVSSVNAGKTLVSSLSFDTPEAEFKYELERNRSYEMLVTLAIEEGETHDPSFRTLADRLVSESRQLRDQAEAKSRTGAHQAAIETIEAATGRLLRALRAAGLPVFE